jgi:hypothetical protein
MLLFKLKHLSKHFVLGLLICFSASTSLAQYDTSFTQHIEIHTNPLTFAYYAPSYRLGAEYVKNKLGYIIEYGFGNTTFNAFRYNGTNGKAGNNYHYNSIRSEFKYYFNAPSSSGKNIYVSSEFFFTHVTDLLYNSYYQKDGEYNNYTYTEADFLLQKYGFHIKVGGKRIFKNGIIVDSYLGFGAINYIIDYSNIKNEQFYDYHQTDGFPFLPDFHKETNTNKFNITMGMKIGYILWKK